MLQPFNKLYEKKKDRLKLFYVELTDIPDMKNMKMEILFEEQYA